MIDFLLASRLAERRQGSRKGRSRDMYGAGGGDSLAQDTSPHPGAMMSFHDQDRQCVVTPPRSEGSLAMGRSFATLRMTGPGLMVKNHHHAATPL